MAAPLRYLIVDDEEIDRLAIEAQAVKFSFLEKMAACSHPLEAIELIDRFKPDIVFADIEMPGMSGLQLVNGLAGKVMAAVFITSHPEFATESYDMEAFDYIVKPVSPERFARCALRLRDYSELRQRAFAFEKEQEKDCIIVKQGHDKYKLPLYDILFLEAMKDYTRIVTTAKQWLVLGTLTGMHEKLPAAKFIRIHRSYVVNQEKISAVTPHKIQLPGFALPVGKLYKHALNGMF